MNRHTLVIVVIICLSTLAGCRETGTVSRHGVQHGVVISKISGIFFYQFNNKTYQFLSYANMKSFTSDPSFYEDRYREINIEAYRFGYSPESIRVRKGDIVRFIVASRDVVHGIRIREYGIEVPVGTGEPTFIEFVADKAGRFDIRCSVYCGSGCKTMAALLIVED